MKRNKIVIYVSIAILLVYPVYLAGKHFGAYIVNEERMKYILMGLILIYPVYLIGKRTGRKVITLFKK